MEEMLARELQSRPFARAQAGEKALILKIAEHLPSPHYLIVRAWQILSSLAPAFSLPASMLEGKSNMDLQLLGPMALLQSVALSECVAAECCGECTKTHPPVYNRIRDVFDASKDIMKTSERPVNAIAMIKRYVPFLKIWLGPNDVDFRQLDRELGRIRVKDENM